MADPLDNLPDARLANAMGLLRRVRKAVNAGRDGGWIGQGYPRWMFVAANDLCAARLVWIIGDPWGKTMAVMPVEVKRVLGMNDPNPYGVGNTRNSRVNCNVNTNLRDAGRRRWNF
jgi:hypothetical protein